MIGTTKEIGFYLSSQTPDIDERCFKNGVPYANTADVLATLTMMSRAKYLTVNIAGIEYWFDTDELDHLVIKNSAISGKAVDITIDDAAEIYESENVEDALQEVMGELISLEMTVAEIPVIPQPIFTINLPTGDVSERASGATGGTGTTGWTYAAASNPNDLQITHNLGRKIAHIDVSYIDGTSEIQLMGNLAYTGRVALSSNVLVIKGLSTKAFPLTIQLIFA